MTENTDPGDGTGSFVASKPATTHDAPPDIVVLPDLPTPAGVAPPGTPRRFLPRQPEEAPPKPPRLWVSLSVLALFVAAGLGLGSNYVLGYSPAPGGAAFAQSQPDAAVSDEPLLSKPAVPVQLPEPEAEPTYQRSWTWQPRRAAEPVNAPVEVDGEESDEAEGIPDAGEPDIDLPEVDLPDIDLPDPDAPDPDDSDVPAGLPGSETHGTDG